MYIRPEHKRPPLGRRLLARAIIGVWLATVWMAFWLSLWRARIRQRRALARLDDRLLRDVGLSRDQARREAAKPFWMP